MKLNVKVNLIKAPKGTVKAFASLNFDDIFIVGGLRVVEGSKGLFVSMPQAKSGDEYKDICYPLTKKAREQISAKILAEYEALKKKTPEKEAGFDEGFMDVPEGEDAGLPFD